MGAEIIEKHITLDRNLKGTDQKGSLAIEGIYRMVRDIRNLDVSLGEEKIEIVNSVESARNKLERSIATNKNLKKGSIIKENDIHLLSPGNGVKWVDKNKVVGKLLLNDLPKDEIIYLKNIK